MKVQEIRKIARKMGVPNIGRMNKAALIHAIQGTEGNPQCYGTDPWECGQDNCLWRADCFALVKSKAV